MTSLENKIEVLKHAHNAHALDLIKSFFHYDPAQRMTALKVPKPQTPNPTPKPQILHPNPKSYTQTPNPTSLAFNKSFVHCKPVQRMPVLSVPV